MKCIILCAGYSDERLEMQNGIPTCLLKITDQKTILDFIIEKVICLKWIDQIFITTNHEYYSALVSWKKIRNNDCIIINDTIDNKNDRLGAVGDIAYTINYQNINDDVLVIFGDNLFDFSLEDFINQFEKNRNTLIAGQIEENKEILSHCGVIKINQQNEVMKFEEKPAIPKGNIKSLGIYAFPLHVLPHIKFYLEEGNRAETPGYFIHYLMNKEKIDMSILNGHWFDIYTNDVLKQARILWSKKN